MTLPCVATESREHGNQVIFEINRAGLLLWHVVTGTRDSNARTHPQSDKDPNGGNFSHVKNLQVEFRRFSRTQTDPVGHRFAGFLSAFLGSGAVRDLASSGVSLSIFSH